ncbi:targeting protein for XKLP2 [Perilla frutescens var. hirtella]|uniref:Targeting protein for XKLP2 n=1 Tax=Perilla frutescens var. hirtella TaxID=608512 RepID=A0AAD4PC67_PERFH|nr:targeting protein for XKLP2 [Perilla frutescens var. hirtella]
MAAVEESTNLLMIDEAYEFSAPRFHDFMSEETDEDVRKAELWFDNARAYAPSPCMPRIRATRTAVQQILCNFNEEEQMQKAARSSENAPSADESVAKSLNQTSHQSEGISTEITEEARTHISQPDHTPTETKETVSTLIEKTLDVGSSCSQENRNIVQTGEASSSVPKEAAVQGPEVCCTPAPQRKDDKKLQTAKKIASILKNPSAINSKKQLPKSQAKSAKPASVRRDTNARNIVGTPIFAHENHAIKKQKLDGGKSRQILTVNKPSNLPHKTRAGIVNSSSNFCPATAKTTYKEDRKMYFREPAAPFVSMAEMMKKFQSGTREMSLPRGSCSLSQSDAGGAMQRKSKLTLTRPKTPEFETSQRVRSVKIKSSAEIEEEMMAKIPKFKARPLNKKIFEASTLPPLPRSTPHLPEFKEFHLETMSRATQNAETSTVASFESTESHQWKPHHLTAPKSPVLQTTLRARPPRIKSSVELEKEELENISQFKARPLNRKIFESKGDMGIFCNMKKQVTIPQEFNFAIDKRIPPPTAVVDLFDKLSICSESQREKPFPRNTTPNPFHLHTEERGAEKERRIAEELMQKQLEEERARVPKAHPYPYTTDYPVIPPKPEPKPCTRPEPFQLESLLRHEQEIQREMEERRRMEMEEAEMRKFKAQPILQEDPIPLPEKERKPLTEVQEFNLHVENRAVDRSEFDKKIKEKEMVYKRYRDEAEAAKMMEEEKALKQLRRTLVPHARPVPNFDRPFLPQKSGREITKAKSPKLHVNRRKEKRRMMCPTTAKASGAAACHMR